MFMMQHFIEKIRIKNINYFRRLGWNKVISSREKIEIKQKKFLLPFVYWRRHISIQNNQSPANSIVRTQSWIVRDPSSLSKIKKITKNKYKAKEKKAATILTKKNLSGFRFSRHLKNKSFTVISLDQYKSNSEFLPPINMGQKFLNVSLKFQEMVVT